MVTVKFSENTSTEVAMIALSKLGLAATLALLSLAGTLATGLVVARLAAHIRDDAWTRIAIQSAGLRRREHEIHEAIQRGTCTRCGGARSPSNAMRNLKRT
jgi:hypothetical protein